MRKLARGTSLHANCEKVITELEELYQKVLGILERAGEGGEEGGNITAFSEGNITTSSEGNILSREDFFWAHDMYYSRRYPTRLLSGIRQSNTEGMLVPFLDRLNHRANEKVLWEEGGEEGVGMRVGGGDGVQGGEEVFQNYGRKGNEVTMLHYGFAEEDNEYDTFPLQLKMVLGGGGRLLKLEPFW